MLNLDFYTGFEGSGEIIFKRIVNGDVESIHLWEGYFDDLIIPMEISGNGQWEGLAQHYHLNTGWYETPDWKIPNVPLIIKQLENVKLTNSIADRSTLEKIRNHLLDFLIESDQIQVDVFIDYS